MSLGWRWAFKMTSDFLDMLYSRMFFPLTRCPTRITANKAIDIFMNYPLVPQGRQQERHKFTYLIMKNNSFARCARAFFIFWTFQRPSHSFHDMKWVVLQLCGRREHLMTNVPFCLLTSKALVSFNFLQDIWNTFCQRIVLALNNREMVAEMRSYILDDFPLSSTSCLLKLPW